jgi:hypothetical protein
MKWAPVLRTLGVDTIPNLKTGATSMRSQAYFVGIDLHKELIQVCVLNAHGEKVMEQRFLAGAWSRAMPWSRRCWLSGRTAGVTPWRPAA